MASSATAISNDAPSSASFASPVEDTSLTNYVRSNANPILAALTWSAGYAGMTGNWAGMRQGLTIVNELSALCGLPEESATGNSQGGGGPTASPLPTGGAT